MTDATDGAVSPGGDLESHLAHIDQVVGCVELWEQLSADRERHRETTSN